MKIKKLFSTLVLSLISLASVSSLNSCKDENKYVRIGVREDIESLNLYLIGKATGNQTVSNYVYFSTAEDYVTDMLNSLASPRGVDIAYFNASDLNEVAKHDDLHVVFIDSFKEDGSIDGVWVARDRYINKCPTYFPKVVKGLASCANYRYSNNAYNNYNEAYNWTLNAINEDEIYFKETYFTKKNNIKLTTDTLEYCALYAISNIEQSDSLKDDEIASRKAKFDASKLGVVYSLDQYIANYSGVCTNNEETNESKKKYTIDKTSSGYLQLVSSYQTMLTANNRNIDEFFMLDNMVSANYQIKNSVTVEKKQDYTKVILISSGAVIIVGCVVAFVIIKSKKTKNGLFDLKEAINE